MSAQRYDGAGRCRVRDLGLAARFGEPVRLVARAPQKGSTEPRAYALHPALGLVALADHPLVGDVRARGLLAGIELVTDKRAKTKPERELVLAKHIARAGYDNALLFRAFADDVIGLAPLLIITTAEVDLLVDRLTKTLDDILSLPEVRHALA